MGAVDRLHDGRWVECPHPGMCKHKLHLPNLTVAEVEQLPFDALLPILNVIDQPDLITFDGAKYWLAEDGVGAHRDYDLPALIETDGTLHWMDHSKRHRGGDKPATIGPNGWRAWWVYGQRHRTGGPAVIHTQSGTIEYWVRGVQYDETEMREHRWL